MTAYDVHSTSLQCRNQYCECTAEPTLRATQRAENEVMVELECAKCFGLYGRASFLCAAACQGGSIQATATGVRAVGPVRIETYGWVCVGVMPPAPAEATVPPLSVTQLLRQTRMGASPMPASYPDSTPPRPPCPKAATHALQLVAPTRSAASTP